jgi:Ca-activated chloride channel family protein
MNAIKTALILILTLVSTALGGPDKPANTGAVSGCLTDAETGRPIIAAWVAVLENNQGARTDSAGCFVIKNLKPGTYNLVVTHEQYGTVQALADLVVTIQAAGVTPISVSLIARLSKTKDQGLWTEPTVLDELGDLSGERRDKEEEKLSSLSPGSNNFRGFDAVPKKLREGYLDSRSRLHQQGKRQPESYYRPAEDDYSWPPRDMFFQDYGTNGFTDTRRDRFSTFATDVDDASYTLVRQYLLEGNSVPSDAVRVEEFINHFDYGYNVPEHEKFRVFTEITDSPFERGRQIMKIAIKGREIDRRERKPLNITFVVDVSGSMGQGNRFQLVRQSIRSLVKQLNRNDRVGIVAYGSNAYVALEPVKADRRRMIFEAVDRLHPGGSTYAEAGIRLGYEMANRQFVNGHSNIVILCSDGVANVGRTNPDAIMNQIDRWAKKGISLNSYGYGMGNYNDVLLEQLAQKGNGRYGYINDQDEVRKVFVDDFISNTQILARDVKVQVEFDPQLVQSYRLLGYENRDVPDHRFRDNRQDGGEVGAGYEVTALYELTMQPRRSKGRIATVFVRWKNPDEREISELSREVRWGRNRQSFKQSRPELRLALVAGRFAEILKGTAFGVETSFADLYRIAQPLRRDLPGEQTDELLELIRRAGNLSDWHSDGGCKTKEVFGNYKR